MNKELASGWQPIIRKKAALPDADQWGELKHKLYLLARDSLGESGE